MMLALGSAVKFSLTVFFADPSNTGDKASDHVAASRIDFTSLLLDIVCVYIRFLNHSSSHSSSLLIFTLIFAVIVTLSLRTPQSAFAVRFMQSSTAL